MNGVRPDYKERVAAWKKRDEKEQQERLLRLYFKPEFIEHHRADAERQFAALRPEIVERLKQRDAERDARQEAEPDPVAEALLKADFDFDEFLALQGPSVAEAFEVLDGALRREADLRSWAREEARLELEEERKAFESMRAEAAAAPTNDLGEIEMDFSRDSSGKISSPVRITGGAGEYEMTFARGKNGRITRATLKPRG